jgi:hypothetical protein
MIPSPTATTRLGHAKEIEDDGSPSTRRRLDVPRDPRRRCANDHVADSCRECPKRRHLPVCHEHEEDHAHKPPEVEKDQVLLIGEKATQ